MRLHRSTILTCGLTRSSMLFLSIMACSKLLGQNPLALETVPQITRTAIGVTREGAPIESWIHRDDFDLQSKKIRILLIGGLAGESHSAERVREAVHWFYTSQSAATWRDRFSVAAVPAANPDAVRLGTGPKNSVGGNPTRGYPPPRNTFYHSPKEPEAAYLWRWIGMHAPDLVVDVRGEAVDSGKALKPESPSLSKLIERLDLGQTGFNDDELVVQLQQSPPADVGIVPAIKLTSKDNKFLEQLLTALVDIQWNEISPARRELQSRLDRSPRQVAQQLSQVYGDKLPEVAYIPAVALIGRLRYGELANDPTQRTDVEQIVSPFFRGEKTQKVTAGNLQSGHLIFCELAARSTDAQRSRYIELARTAADQAFDDEGRPLEAMPFHLEMSDSLFMGGPILAHVGSLTGEDRYFDACIRHLRFMRKLCLREDGLYRHSPLDESAWGRGNGFPAVGLAWCLSHFPPDHAHRAELLDWFTSHMNALRKHQDPTGCWHQVIDHPESYRELTATCMIGFAMSRGVREGWLDKTTFRPSIDRAWYAVKTRVAANGGLVDVCTGTGKQKSLRDYYDRPAILGSDDRGGAMALLFATELAVNDD